MMTRQQLLEKLESIEKNLGEVRECIAQMTESKPSDREERLIYLPPLLSTKSF